MNFTWQDSVHHDQPMLPSDQRNKIHTHTSSQAGLYYKLRCRPKALFTIASAGSCCVLQQSNDDDDDGGDDDVSGLVCVLEELERRNWSAGDRGKLEKLRYWRIGPEVGLVSSCANFDQGAPFINNFEVKLGTVVAISVV